MRYINALVGFILAFFLVTGAFAQTGGQPDGIPVKVGTVYYYLDSANAATVFQTFTAKDCPANIYVHDTMWQIPGGYVNTRPTDPLYLHDTVIIKRYDTIYNCPPTVPPVTPPVTNPTLVTVFTTQTFNGIVGNDGGGGIEVGMRFRSSVAGYIKGIRFLKTAASTGTHVGELYTTLGTKLGAATFTNETASGWQTVAFATPIAIVAGATYVAAYYSPTGTYVETFPFFNTALVNAPLSALATGTDGVNGVFKKGPAPAFPNSTSSDPSPNYWVDVIYSATK